MAGDMFDPNKDIPDLSGKVYVVTGGTAGIGFGISAHLLQHGAAKIYLLGRKEEHGEEAQKELEKYGDPSKAVEFIKCDFEDLKQTDQVARDLARLEKLDGLICNAGLGVGNYAETVDGIDSHMQVNHFAQAHLILMLLPLLLRTSNSRLVLQSSTYHRLHTKTIEFASLEEINTDIGASDLYGRTKLAQILFLRALVRRLQKGELGCDPEKLKDVGPWVNASHPGGVRTDQQDQAVEAYGTLGKVAVKAVRPFMKDPVDEGCRPALFAATSEDIAKDRVQGEYIVPDRKITEVSKEARDDELGERLWGLTEKILADKLGPQPYMKIARSRHDSSNISTSGKDAVHELK